MEAALKIVRFPDDASLMCRYRNEPRFEFNWHFHPECQIELLIRGKERLFVGDRILSFEAGQLLLLGPNLPHSMLTEREDVWDGAGQQSVLIQFPHDILGEELLHRPELRSVQRLLERSRCGLIYSAHDCRHVCDRVASLPGLPAFERLQGLLWTLHKLGEVEHGERLASETFQSSAAHMENERISIVCNYVQQHLADNISESKVADLIYVTRSAFSRFFKRLTGMTFVDYVNGLRIGRACRRLIESDDSVLEICLHVGFGNKSNFNRQFKRRKGMTPSRFRKTYRSN